MHPELLSRLAAGHAADLHASAERARLIAHRLPRTSRRLRRRAGWWMVGVGLKLATGRP